MCGASDAVPYLLSRLELIRAVSQGFHAVWDKNVARHHRVSWSETLSFDFINFLTEVLAGSRQIAQLRSSAPVAMPKRLNKPKMRVWVRFRAIFWFYRRALVNQLELKCSALVRNSLGRVITSPRSLLIRETFLSGRLVSSSTFGEKLYAAFTRLQLHERLKLLRFR